MKQMRTLHVNDAEDASLNAPRVVMSADFSENKAAIRIQSLFLRALAFRTMTERFTVVWQRVFDPKFRIYFWFNNISEVTQWERPLQRLTVQFSITDIRAVRLMQRVTLKFIGCMRTRRIAHIRYTRYFDPSTNKFYWIDNVTKITFWNASKWLVRQNVPMPEEDSLLFRSQLRIKELEEILRLKDIEIKSVRKKRFDQLEPLVTQDKVNYARDVVRSKHMDEWTVDQLSAWMCTLHMQEHVHTLFSQGVDGLLFLNLADSDWAELNITSNIHYKKLQIVMRSYRLRYQRKKDRSSSLDPQRDGEDDDDLSEYSPSELSNLIAAENRSVDGSEFDEDDDGNDDGEGSQGSFDETSEEEKIEEQLDNDNINIEVIIVGDETNYPMVGDVIRVRYTCSLVSGSKVLASTKADMNKSSVEFVLGFNQVIKGFDRAIPRMSLGERSKITFTPEYAYGKEGLFPTIPPHAEIEFDITLLGFMPRIAWNKPLVQHEGLCQEPYAEDPEYTELDNSTY